MKKIIFVAAIISIFSTAAQAASPMNQSGFFFKPYLSIEYSAPDISGGGTNVNFKTSQNFFSQMRDLENLALGGNFRVHKNLGFNINWAQTDMENYALQAAPGGLTRKANFRLDQYNFTALGYFPVVKDSFELFVEGGAADITSKLNYAGLDGVFHENKAHETKAVYGAGFQLYVNPNNIVRFSVQKYAGKLALLDSHFTTIRIGYLASF